ncbi:arylsulfatase [Rhodopirellula sallentina]|uniref:Arylsulfatase n=1 Tax=Rhodopirellula sallentina SM41 TaxID=1263870 RepID=M5U2R2_9BACT|nr:arylsulfatase [Rhodopirellula sallentina]EMI52151.1 arylsulfatase [Rhodopirellula sallentina SM41]
MNRRLLVVGMVCFLSLFIVGNTSSLASDQDATPPNIVLILADDLGYGELGCYGQQKIKTPNLDRLAEQGMRLTEHYCGAPVCAPSRCVLMSGRHLGHSEIRGNRDSGNGKKFPGQWPISDALVTIAEVLQRAGYATGGFGKWGLGPTESSGGPNRQGFDRFFGYNCQRNAHSYYPPFLDSDDQREMLNESPVTGHLKKPSGEVVAEDYRADVYAPDRILTEALDWLDQNSSGPFFLYLPFVEPHVAMQPPQEWIDRYPKQWDAENGPYRGQNGYLPHPRPRAAYAAMISDLDEHVGAVMDRLKKRGVEDNTIVVFTSDNGPTHGGRDPRFHIGGAACSFFDSAAGLKGYKGSCYEGGLKVPCLVRWPGKVAAGSISSVPSYFPDWFATLVAISGVGLSGDQRGDGVDLTPALTGKGEVCREQPMIWEFAGYGGIFAIRDGEWKAVRRQTKRKKPAAWELYHLATDPYESTDVAANHPEIVDRLEREFLENRFPEPDFPQPLID